MRVDAPIKYESLAALGDEVVRLLCRGETGVLAAKYGYALAQGRDIEAAIQEDLRRCLDEVGAISLGPIPEGTVPRVLLFKPEESSLPFLVGVVECLVPTEQGRPVLVEVVITRSEGENYATLEQISATDEE